MTERHDLAADHNGDPVCTCGFTPHADTVRSAVSLVRAHVRVAATHPTTSDSEKIANIRALVDTFVEADIDERGQRSITVFDHMFHDFEFWDALFDILDDSPGQ